MRRAAAVDADHRDGSWRRADQGAEVAADALLFDDAWISNAVDLVELEALVSTILTRDVTKVAADAMLGVDVRLDVIVEVEVSPIGRASDGLSYNVIHARKAFLIEIVVQPVDHVLDDAITVMHNGRAYLDVPCA